MIIKGVARFHKEKKKHIITLQTVSAQHMHLKLMITCLTGAQVRARLVPEAFRGRF